MQSILQTKGVNHALNMVGSYETYQYRSLLIMVVQHLFRAFFMMYYPFMDRAPIFSCKDEEGNLFDCTENQGGCTDRVFSPNSPTSFVIDLGFYCEQSYVRTIAGILFFLGGNIGNGYFSYVSDKQGRKPAMLYSYVLGAVFLFFFIGFSSGPISYICLLMLTWGSMSCFIGVSLTYLAEIGNEKFGKQSTLVILLEVTISQLVVVALAYFIPSYKIILYGFIAVPLVLASLLFFYVKETPVYLLSKNRVPEAIEALREIATVNEKPFAAENQEPAKSDKQLSAFPEAEEEKQTSKSWNYIEILTHPKLRVSVISYSVVKLYLYMAYFGCLFALSSLGGNMYVNCLVSATAEIIGYGLSFKAYLFPYKKLTKGGLSVVVGCGFSFLLVPYISSTSTDSLLSPLFLQGFLALIMRVAICFVYGFIYSMGNELFPPEVRSQSVGVSEIASALGGMFAPIIILFANTYSLNVLFLFGTLGFPALLASQYIPEKEISLEDESNDIELNYILFKEKNANNTDVKAV